MKYLALGEGSKGAVEQQLFVSPRTKSYYVYLGVTKPASQN